MAGDPKEYAKTIFVHYLQLIAQAAGVPWQRDYTAEIEAAVESIVEAAVEEGRAAIHTTLLTTNATDAQLSAELQGVDLNLSYGIDTLLQALHEIQTRHSSPHLRDVGTRDDVDYLVDTIRLLLLRLMELTVVTKSEQPHQ